MGATDKWANGKFAGLAIGLGLTLIHLISIPITNTSVNLGKIYFSGFICRWSSITAIMFVLGSANSWWYCRRTNL